MKITNHKSQIKNLRAFTLLETLVVIAIIGLLAGLLLPVLSATRQRARIARAKREVKEIRDAWDAYLLQYKRFPSGVTEMNSNALAILRGRHEYNPRGIQYLDIRANVLYYSDPWGTPDTSDRAYRVALDTEGSNQVTRSGRTLPVSVAVWSLGPDGAGFNDDDITSWEGGWPP